MKSRLKSMICFVLCALLIIPNFAFAQQKEDYLGHWAEKEIKTWIQKGIIVGLPDGSVKPNNDISRAEFMAIVNRVFGFKDKAEIAYSDVKPGDWFYNEVAAAVKAGYIGGFADGTMKPKAKISRQEVAAILARVLKLDTTNKSSSSINFADKKDIPAWSLGSVMAVADKGFMIGNKKGEFNPLKSITRAEVFVLLDRSYLHFTRLTYAKSGTYKAGTVDGSLIIDAKDVTLEDTVVNGNLTISPSVGDGNVYLKNVTVKGEIVINGGGMNSISLDSCQIAKLTANKADGKVRILATGNTKVQSAKLKSGAKLESGSSNNTYFSKVLVDEAVNADSIVELIGNFDSVEVVADGVSLRHRSGTIKDMSIKSTAANTIATFESSTKITNLTIDASTKIYGSGNIETARVNAAGVNITAFIKNLIKPQTLSVSVNTPTSGTSGGGGGGGGGGSSTPTPQVTLDSVALVDSDTLKVTFNNGAGSNDKADYKLVSGSHEIKAKSISISGYSTTVELETQMIGNVDYTFYYKDQSTGKTVKHTVKEETVEAGKPFTPTEPTRAVVDLGGGVSVAVDLPKMDTQVTIAAAVADKGTVGLGSYAKPVTAVQLTVSGTGIDTHTTPIPVTLTIPAGLQTPSAYHQNNGVWELKDSVIVGNTISFVTTLSAVAVTEASEASVPTGLKALNITSSGLDLTWAKADKAKGYSVYRDGVKLNADKLNDNNYSDSGLKPSTTYKYAVTAYDEFGFETKKSAEVSASTLSDKKENEELNNWIGKVRAMIMAYGVIYGSFDVTPGDLSKGEATQIVIKDSSLESKEISNILMSAIDKAVTIPYSETIQNMLAENMASITIDGKAMNIYIADKLHGKAHSAAAESYFRDLGKAEGRETRYKNLQAALASMDSYAELSATLKEIVAFDKQVYIPQATIEGLTFKSMKITKGDKSFVIEAGKTASVDNLKTALDINSKLTLGSLKGSTVSLVFQGAAKEYTYDFQLGGN